ncbi:MAG: pyruvate dehydrogenase (acetyl-transferring) E1 component subunit alpha [Alphaproteobacteria bacterium]|nr:MAG: pyruvate dehydrogenase (acetyl-transferring) E1 component subunit alpha [Alphaproteobacteria bacterium]
MAKRAGKSGARATQAKTRAKKSPSATRASARKTSSKPASKGEAKALGAKVTDAKASAKKTPPPGHDHPDPYAHLFADEYHREYEASHEEMLGFYRQMLRIRRFEEKAGQLYGMGLIGGFLHLYIGEEAVAVGFDSAAGPQDRVVTGYRCHGHALIAGCSPKSLMAELTGRAPGLCKGKGGSMHMFAPDHRFYGGHGIVGAPAPLGTGLAFAAKYRGEDAVSLTFFGDGATNQGQVYESFNMAVLWKLPVVYVIENNHYAMGTSVDRASGQKDLHKRGESLGVPGMLVDGMNVFKVRAAAEEAIAYIRSGRGPILVEVKTYRYRGHSMSDPAKYRPREEVQEVRAHHDPIELLKERMLDAGIGEAEIKKIDRAVKQEIDEAADFARHAAEPEPDELYRDVLIEEA